MILDTVDQLSQYASMNLHFPKVIEYLRATDLNALDKGKYEIDGAGAYVIIDAREGKGRDGTRMETHRNYLDIQITLAGNEEIGWKPAGVLTQPQAEYDPAKDIQFFSDTPVTWLSIPAGHFGIFFPEDGHAPLAGTGLLRKAIVKVAV